jgi:hypothetical protein
MIGTVGSLMVGSSVFAEQPAKAQNMTTNMTDPAGNMSETEDGSISAETTKSPGILVTDYQSKHASF